MLARARPHVHHEVGAADGVLVMLHHDDRVAEVAQVRERGDEPFVVALMQADGRLVQNVQHAHEPRADLRGEPDALRLAAGERGRGPLEREVVQPHVHEELEPRLDLLHDGPGDVALLALEGKPLEEAQTLGRAHLGDLVDGLAAHRHRENLRLQALAAAGGARHDGEVALQLLALRVALRLLVAAHDRRERALPLDAPIRLAPVHGHVVHAHLLLAEAVQKRVLRLLGHVLPRRVLVHAQVLRHGAQHLRVVVARAEGGDHALGKRQRRVGHHEGGVHLLAAADAEAIRACAVGGVEAEVARLQLVHRMAVLGAREREREDMLARPEATRRARGAPAALPERLAVRPQHLHEHTPVGELRGHLHRLGDAARGALFQLHAVNHHVDEVLDLLVERTRLAVELHDLAVDAHAGEALARQVGEQLRELALAAGHHGRHDDGLGVGRERQYLVGHLVGGLLHDGPPALRAVRHAHAREQKAQVVVYLGGGANSGAGVFARGLLVDGHRGRQPVDAVEVGLAHLPEEHARVAGEALHVAALALGVHRVEGERRLAAARQPRDHHELVTGYREVDVLEIVLAGALDDDGVLSHALPYPVHRPARGATRAEMSVSCDQSL